MRRVVGFFLLLCAIRAEADEAAVRIAPDGDDPTRVVVTCPAPGGVDAASAATAGPRHLTLAVVDEATGRPGEPMFGSYGVADGRLIFKPRFALVRGTAYRAAAGGATFDYRVPDVESGEPAVVRSITPTSDVLPANVLRFYVTFSRPMREGREVLERIQLLNAAGEPIASPWRDIELWNADATRLSLFLHPGRIKQGVNLREELGPLLQPNQKYAVVIPAELRDARGVPLGREVRHTFTTNDELRRRIDVAAWRLTPPQAGSSQPLTIDVDRPLDAALARRGLAIHDAAGAKVAGTWEPAAAERRWAFKPVAPWSAGNYLLDVDPVLEDVCGNTPLREFDYDLDAVRVEVLPPPLRREFTAQ